MPVETLHSLLAIFLKHRESEIKKANKMVQILILKMTNITWQVGIKT